MSSICLFGDSIGKGVVLDTIRGRYMLLKNSFSALFSSNTGISIQNYSKFGCTVTTGKKIIERNQAKLSSFKYTILEFGGNDCDFDWEAISQNPDLHHTPKTELEQFESCYEEIIDFVTSIGSKPILLSLPPLDAKRYFAWISKDRNAGKILHWLGDVEHIYRWHEMYSLAVTRLAAIKNVPLLDIRSTFLRVRNYFGLLCDDGIHPNEEGHRFISGVIQNYVSKAGVQRHPAFLV